MSPITDNCSLTGRRLLHHDPLPPYQECPRPVYQCNESTASSTWLLPPPSSGQTDSGTGSIMQRPGRPGAMSDCLAAAPSSAAPASTPAPQTGDRGTARSSMQVSGPAACSCPAGRPAAGPVQACWNCGASLHLTHPSRQTPLCRQLCDAWAAAACHRPISSPPSVVPLDVAPDPHLTGHVAARQQPGRHSHPAAHLPL
jgi:hypothetical protein